MGVELADGFDGEGVGSLCAYWPIWELEIVGFEVGVDGLDGAVVACGDLGDSEVFVVYGGGECLFGE